MVVGIVDLPIYSESADVGDVGVCKAAAGLEVVLVLREELCHGGARMVGDLEEFVGVDVPDPFVQVAEAFLTLRVGVPLAIRGVGVIRRVVDECNMLLRNCVIWRFGERWDRTVVHHVEAADAEVVIVMAEPFFEVFGLVAGDDTDCYIFIDVRVGAAWIDFGFVGVLLPRHQPDSRSDGATIHESRCLP